MSADEGAASESDDSTHAIIAEVGRPPRGNAMLDSSVVLGLAGFMSSQEEETLLGARGPPGSEAGSEEEGGTSDSGGEVGALIGSQRDRVSRSQGPRTRSQGPGVSFRKMYPMERGRGAKSLRGMG